MVVEEFSFVIPGGKIFVFTGIIPIAKDEDGLAVILGHGKSGVDLKEKKREFRADLSTLPC